VILLALNCCGTQPLMSLIGAAVSLLGAKLHLIDSMAEVAALQSWLGERRPVLAVDTETSGLKPHRDKIRLVQIGDGERGWAIPWDRWGGVAVEALQKYDGPLVLHHSKFDVNFLAEHAPELGAWPWHRTDDTMTMARVLDPVGPAGLKPLGTVHIDTSAAASQQVLHDAMKDNGWTWATVPHNYDLYWIYAALDTVITAKLWELLKPKLHGDLDNVYDLELAVHRVVGGMERRGALVDLDYCRSKRGDLLVYLQQLREWTYQHAGLENPGSTGQCVDALDRAGIDTAAFGFTEAGNVKLDKDTLGEVDHPIAVAILNYRKAQKLVSSYLDYYGPCLTNPPAR
jgi:DNA polymerase-1